MLLTVHSLRSGATSTSQSAWLGIRQDTTSDSLCQHVSQRPPFTVQPSNLPRGSYERRVRLTQAN
jgi:hypothetical protein